MCSVARLTYTQVQQFMDGLIDEEDLALPAGTLHHLNAVFTILKKARDKRGALNLDLAEKRIVMDADNQPAEISLRRQIPANQLIEEMMILANICAAKRWNPVVIYVFFASMTSLIQKKWSICENWQRH